MILTAMSDSRLLPTFFVLSTVNLIKREKGIDAVAYARSKQICPSAPPNVLTKTTRSRLSVSERDFRNVRSRCFLLVNYFNTSNFIDPHSSIQTHNQNLSCYVRQHCLSRQAHHGLFLQSFWC